MTQVLKQYSYKGSPVYIRFLGMRNYETLIVFRNRIHVYQIHVEKPRKQDRRASLKEMHDGVIGELMNVSAQLIDNFKRERSPKNLIKTYLKQLHGKTTKIIGNVRESIRVSVGRIAGREESAESRSAGASGEVRE